MQPRNLLIKGDLTWHSFISFMTCKQLLSRNRGAANDAILWIILPRGTIFRRNSPQENSTPGGAVLLYLVEGLLVVVIICNDGVQRVLDVVTAVAFAHCCQRVRSTGC